MARRQPKPAHDQVISPEAQEELTEAILRVLSRKNGHFVPISPDQTPDLMRSLMVSFFNAALEGEMRYHMQHPDPDNQVRQTPQEPTEGALEQGIQPPANKRNGFSRKTVHTDQGDVELKIPRDRYAGFDPLIVPKYARYLPKLNDQIICMYGRGMTQREIQAFLQEQYGMEVSAEFISKVTDAVLEEVREWRSRPLETVYPVVFFDALRVNIRRDGVTRKEAVHLALGIRCDGTRDVLGMWMNDNEGAAYWTQVFTELKSRGVKDILIAVTDGLKGMTQAIEAVFPKTQHQTCIVHLIRASTAFISYKDRKAVMALLKPIYRAINAQEAERALEALEGSAMGKRYPAIAKTWRTAWAQVIPFFSFPPEIRRLIYTSNSIEALNRGVRKVIKTRTVFPTEEAAQKLIYLALKNITAKWKRASPAWSAAMPVFACMYGERFTRAA